MNQGYFSSAYFLFAVAHLVFEIYYIFKSRNRVNMSLYEIIGILISSSIFYFIPYSREPELVCSDIVNNNRDIILNTICNKPYIVNIVISLIPITFLFIRREKGEYYS